MSTLEHDPSLEGNAAESNEIDYLLAFEAEKPAQLSNNIQESLREKLGRSPGGIVFSVIFLVANFYGRLALKRISYVLCTQKELEADGIWSSNAVSKEKVTKRKTCSAFFSFSILAPTLRTICDLYHREGLCGFARGARLHGVLSLLSYMENAALALGLRRLAAAVPPSFTPFSSSFYAKMLWLGVVPLGTWAVTWPLRAVRTTLLSTYMSDVRAAVKDIEHAEGHAEPSSNKSGKIPGVSSLLQQPQSPCYRYNNYTQLFSAIARVRGLRGILTSGWDIDLVDYVAGILLSVFMQCSRVWVSAADHYIASRLLLSEVTCDWLQISFFAATTIATVIVRQPLLVMSRRMALLQEKNRRSPACSAPHSNSVSVAEFTPVGSEQRRHQWVRRRYYSMWDCMRHISRLEGWTSFFAGLTFNLSIQCLLLTYWFAQQRLWMEQM